MSMNPIAEAIQKGRMQAGMTEKVLAKKCGLSETYIKQVESGKKVINEEAAKKILLVLGTEPEILIQGSSSQQSEPAEQPVSVPGRKQPQIQETRLPLEPNDQWTDALAHIIKRFPVEDLITGNIIGYKALPLLGKNIDGCKWESVRFFQVSDQQMQHMRINLNDIVMVCEAEAITNGKVYVVEIGGKRMIRKLTKMQNNKVAATTGKSGADSELYQPGQLKVIGRCMKVEFNL
jgi:transcriptional regulator with XRE-family HTH domain